MINLLILDENGNSIVSQDIDWLKRAIQQGYRFWMDLDNPDEEDFTLLEENFHFHPLHIQDIKLDLGVPKIDAQGNYLFLVLHRIFYHLKEERCEAREVEIFISEKYLVTVHGPNLSRTFNVARNLIQQNSEETLKKGPLFILYALLKMTFSDYHPLIERCEEDLEHIETEVLKGNGKAILNEILRFKKLVLLLLKNLIPQRDILKSLLERSMIYSNAEAKTYFKNLIDQMDDLLHSLESLREHIKSVFEVYVATLTLRNNEASQQLNYVMQRLTIATTIFMPLTFIVGVYGMNFKHMPELDFPWGYYGVWGFMLAFTISMVLFFKRKKWW
ncbi:MAG: magnesium/cobalt transporter CorA [Deltaproteobacteria bacterium]|nr:magnesium/cobalt transporter CorA [Deltaproteobacteria bacterium]